MSVELNSMTGVPTFENYYKYITLNPIIITVVIVVFLAYILLFTSLAGSSEGDGLSAESSGKFLGIVVASIFIVLLLINYFRYFFNMNIVTTARNIFTSHPEIDFNINTRTDDISISSEPDGAPGSTSVPEQTSFEQVYHIPGNEYTYIIRARIYIKIGFWMTRKYITSCSENIHIKKIAKIIN